MTLPGRNLFDCAIADAFMPENRRTCQQCKNLRAGVCTAQSKGSRKYRPQISMLFRCEWYEPGPNDPDQRSAGERWPGLSNKK
jgi:hypothetical protein